MRNNIIHPRANELTYEIREIVEVGEELAKLGVKISWENIGDPVAKGAKIPDWIKKIIKKALDDEQSFAYCPTKGLIETRTFLAERCNHNACVKIKADDIIFFNGLGDAIAKVYTYLNREARVIGPSPAYSTHSSAEAAHAGSDYLTYNLLPYRNWLPDLDDLRNKVRYNPSISGILIINPDNPTGMVYPQAVLREMVKIAREYDLFIISDEIYLNITHGNERMIPLRDIIEDVPAIAMRGISKELPWPGARCGWIEVYNKDKDPIFARYIKSLVNAKMLEVCSTTLPQMVIPEIMSDPKYREHLESQNNFYKKRADLAYAILRNTPNVVAPKSAGAFYMSVVFAEGALNNKQKLEIEDEKVKNFIEEKTKDVLPDKRFVYFLLAKTGICVVPLSGFNSSLSGFRITLLEQNEEKFRWIFETIKEAIKEYLSS